MTAQSNPAAAAPQVAALPARRRYRLGRRQAAIDATRQRIVEAAFDLHTTSGPGRTTIAAVAARAGVQRHTVYAHFADPASLFEACTAHGIEAMAMPDPARWPAKAAPDDRLERGLRAMVAWYRANGAQLERLLDDDPAPSSGHDPGSPAAKPAAKPAAAPAPDPFAARMAAIRAAVVEGWDVPSSRRVAFDAVVDHALAFSTWQSLAAGGLRDAAIVRLLASLVRGVADGSISTTDGR